MGGLEVDGWRWRLLWRRSFFTWEKALNLRLGEIIRGFQPVDREDSWRWVHDPHSGFTAKLAYYSLVLVHSQQSDLNQLQRYVFNNIWMSGAPSKVSSFSWQLLLNRIPTMDNLMLRGFHANGNSICYLCNGYAETAGHLFIHCEITTKIWYDNCQVVWISDDVTADVESFFCYDGQPREREERKERNDVNLAFFYLDGLADAE
jgi:hypothetical protein